jgi:hypothetical protein
MPTTAIRTSLFEPAACDHERGDRLQAAAVMNELFKNVRRVREVVFMLIFLVLLGDSHLTVREGQKFTSSSGQLRACRNQVLSL